MPCSNFFGFYEICYLLINDRLNIWMHIFYFVHKEIGITKNELHTSTFKRRFFIFLLFHAFYAAFIRTRFLSHFDNPNNLSFIDNVVKVFYLFFFINNFKTLVKNFWDETCFIKQFQKPNEYIWVVLYRQKIRQQYFLNLFQIAIYDSKTKDFTQKKKSDPPIRLHLGS